MITDKNDVPLLIQSLVYNYGWMMFEADFFNGLKLRFCSDDVLPSMSLMQKQPTKMQMLEAENNITNLALSQWGRLNEKTMS